MKKEPTGTKLALILAAGELFAEHGFEGTSIRAIAEKAGANIAAINYHFGTKENLYVEAVLYVVLQHPDSRPTVVLENEDRLNSPLDIARAISDMVKQRFASYFSAERPRWYHGLVMRSLLEPSPALEAIVEQVFLPDYEALKTLFRRANPALSDQEAQLMAFSFFGQISFYAFARLPVLVIMQQDHYKEAFLDAAADHVARTILSAVGLPEPSGSRSE